MPLNIVVCVKQVPDTWAERTLDATDKTLDRAKVDTVMNEIDEYAVEEALRLKEAHGGEVTIVTMGPDRAMDTVRKALSMGADKAVLLSDEALHGSCVMQTSDALAKVIATLEYDLVICGSEATDARLSVMAPLLAERLGIPQLSLARKVTVEPGAKVTIERQTENGYALVESAMPAVVSVVEKINEPRYPSFKGIMAAKNKPTTRLTAAEAGLTGELGLAGATSQVVDSTTRPPRSGGEIVKNEGDGGVKVADFLVAQKLL